MRFRGLNNLGVGALRHSYGQPLLPLSYLLFFFLPVVRSYNDFIPC